MRQDGDFKYQQTADFQAVQLPYAGGLQMQIFLPATNSNPQKLLESFKAGGNWKDNVESGFAQHKGLLILPKFKIEYSLQLNESLESLGMKRAFDADKADFSSMADEPLYVSEVKQKSFVEVNEEGTEAAAVTTVTMHATAVFRPEKPFEMIVDRPFLFVIGDDSTKSILFMGVIYDPAG